MTTEAFLLSHALQQAADRVPDQRALVIGDDAITYRALADRVARFAGWLIRSGVERGDRVVIYASKSIDAAVAIHGAQWAGAVAVPVDAAAPVDAVHRMLADADPAVVVCESRTEASATAFRGVVILSSNGSSSQVGATWEDVAVCGPASIAPVLADDPAYILYTSGSTGEPKGIVHSHRSGLRYAQLAAETYGLTEDDRMANIAPFHFDQSTFELYSAVVAGATTVLVPEILLKFPAEVAALIDTAKITIWYSVPTLLVHMLERGGLDTHDLSSLRWVLFGGEVFATEPLTLLMQHLPAARFSNVYGPTEVNQCTFHHMVDPPASGAAIPIGQAWGDTETRVVAGDGTMLEGAGTGTLEVRTSTMMLGYWQRPDLTEASVVTHSSDAGLVTRWYRTGDLVDRKEDGQLVFLGRSDRQVKVNGFRIELEGIEAALSNAPGVVRSAVIVDRSESMPRLVGVAEGNDADPAEVLARLRQVLPPQAVPSIVHMVDELPRTRSGKVDSRRVEEVINSQGTTQFMQTQNAKEARP